MGGWWVGWDGCHSMPFPSLVPPPCPSIPCPTFPTHTHHTKPTPSFKILRSAVKFQLNVLWVERRYSPPNYNDHPHHGEHGFEDMCSIFLYE